MNVSKDKLVQLADCIYKEMELNTIFEPYAVSILLNNEQKRLRRRAHNLRKNISYMKIKHIK